MKITFGLHLDGQRSWARQNRLGQATSGPLGMLGYLETFLGLPKPGVSESERILEYRALLEELDSPARFYHHSFQADQYAVARTLLRWRDEWYLHGWSGRFPEEMPPRLRDMGDIELAAVGRLTPGVGERLAAVSQALDHRKTPIEVVELVDPLQDFPLAWRRVLEKLLCHQRAGVQPTEADTNLRNLQRALLNPSGVRIAWRQDQSIQVYRSHTRLASAGLLAGVCGRQPDQTLLVAEAEGALFDTLSSAYGNARLGISERSELRPPLQLLSLAFALLWKPLDVYALLEFLAHPMSPLPGFAGGLLADAVASQPGIGGEKWCDALAKIESIADDDAPALLATIAEWIQPPAIDAEAPVAVDVLEGIASRVAKAFRSRLGTEDSYAQRALHSGNTQCIQIARALALLRRQGIVAISRLELDQLFEETIASGESSAASIPETGGCLLATHPAAAVESHEAVVWWNLAAPAMPSGYPWHKHELKALRAAGVALPEMEALLDIQARSWLKPVLAARQQLVLSLPPEGDEVHPLWLMIERVFEKNAIPICQVEDVLEGRLARAETEAVPHRPLPQLRRWWHLEKGEIPFRKDYSFSSLDKFIHNPFEWVMRYPAQLSPPRILSVSSGNMLLGSIAHRAMELLHRQPDALSLAPEAAVVWVEKRLSQLLEEEGAVLLLPGQRAGLEAFRQKLLFSVSEMQRQLQQAQVVRVEPEKQLAGSFFMGNLNGFIDILATRADGRSAVVDMKWARSKAYREKLQDNKHLQLAIYGELVRQQSGQWAVPAYFILTEGKLYAQEQDFFPLATVARAREDGGSALLWQQAQDTLHWRHAQIANGSVELVFDGSEADETSQVPEGALPVEGPSPWAGDFDTLAGWGADA